MKTIIWKIRYTVAIWKLLRLPLSMRWFRMCWEMAGSTLEWFGGDLTECTPTEAAEEEVEAWRQNS